MNKAEEQCCNRCPQKENCDYIKINIRSKCTTVGDYTDGYNQAEQDLMDKAKQWFTEYIADKSVQLLWCEFEQFITEN